MPSVLPTPTSHLPATQPGTGPDEGVFLVTTADDGSRATYFIAGNARHSILAADMQLELQLNPLWPVRTVSPDDVLGFAEGAPIGKARQGLVSGSDVAPEPAPEDPAPLTSTPAPIATNADTAEAQSTTEVVETPASPAPVAADDEQPVAADDEQPVADTPDSPTATTYTVKRGDTAFLIARHFGISQSALLAANGIANANRVYVGQVLAIPAS